VVGHSRNSRKTIVDRDSSSVGTFASPGTVGVGEPAWSRRYWYLVHPVVWEALLRLGQEQALLDLGFGVGAEQPVHEVGELVGRPLLAKKPGQRARFEEVLRRMNWKEGDGTQLYLQQVNQNVNQSH